MLSLLPLLARGCYGGVDAQGYRKVGDGAADFQVAYRTLIVEKHNLQSVNDYYGYDPAWGWGGEPDEWGEDTVEQYEEGSLILDVSIPSTNYLIWRATAAAEMLQAATPEEREQRVSEAVAKMLALFPSTAN